jgi:hypothetical protein
VSRTHVLQAGLILTGMAAVFVVLVARLPADISVLDATRIAGQAGRLNAIDPSFSLTDRYTLWSGLIGGFFLALSYFGTDQSQVQRYLQGRSLADSRIGLLLNGLLKVPMQFAILFVGAAVFAFYQFTAPPVFFNPIETARVRASAVGTEFAAVELRYADAIAAREVRARELARALEDGGAAAKASAATAFRAASDEAASVRGQAIELIKRAIRRRTRPTPTTCS